jgi:hypothetical protein
MPSPEKLERLYSEEEGYAKPYSGVDGWESFNEGQSLYIRKYSADYSLEMRRSVAAMLQEWSQD